MGLYATFLLAMPSQTMQTLSCVWAKVVIMNNNKSTSRDSEISDEEVQCVVSIRSPAIMEMQIPVTFKPSGAEAAPVNGKAPLVCEQGKTEDTLFALPSCS